MEKISDKCVPIILLDWNVITNGKYGSYNGHFVPIVGFDKEFIYVHQQSGDTAKPYFKIKNEIFEKARKSNGTDEEIIFIFN